jgi:hypothetical protein
MTVNYAETKEIVFRRLHSTKLPILPTFYDIELVHDVYLSDKLSFEEYVSQVLASCSKRFYLLKMLRDGGMPLAELRVIFFVLLWLIAFLIALLHGDVE